MASDAPTLLLTRPLLQSERFAKLCRDRLGGVSVIVSPAIQIVSTAEAVDLNGFEGVVLTSANGARALWSVAAVAGMRAWCVGERTAEVARSLGMRAISAGGNADALVDMLVRIRPQGALLHAHGARTQGNVTTRLRTAGIRAESKKIYEQIPVPLSDAARACLESPKPVLLPLFSPRTALLVGNQAGTAIAPLSIAALSQPVAEAWSGPTPRQLVIAERPAAPNMLESIVALWTALVS